MWRPISRHKWYPHKPQTTRRPTSGRIQPTRSGCSRHFRHSPTCTSITPVVKWVSLNFFSFDYYWWVWWIMFCYQLSKRSILIIPYLNSCKIRRFINLCSVIWIFLRFQFVWIIFRVCLSLFERQQNLIYGFQR